MARINSLTNFLNDVATAIKQKTGDNTPIPASEFDTEILSIEVAGTYQQKTLTITQNGQMTLIPDTGFDAMDQVAITVNVPIKQLQSKTVSVTSNGNVTLLPDTDYDGFSEVNLQVNVSTIDTSDATAIPDDVLSPKTFYSNGQKLTGRITGHRTPLGETLEINSSFVETISNYDTCINNQNIVCKYNSSGYVTFYKADMDHQTLTLLYTTDLSGVYFTMSDCYYGSTDNEYDILLVTKNKSDDSTKGQTFKTYVLKVRNTITFEALTEKDLVYSDRYSGRLYSVMSNGIWYVFLAHSSYNTYSSSEAYCRYQIYQADYSFNGTLNYITKSSASIYTGRIATTYCYLTGMNVSTLENGTHLVAASSRSNSGYSNVMRIAVSVFSSDFSTELYSSNTSVLWPPTGNAYYGGICAIGKYTVSMYTSDSSSNIYTVRVHEFASNTLTLKSTQTIIIPTDLIGGAPNNPAMFHVLGSYGICLFKRNLYYGFVFTINDSGEFVMGENLMNGGSEYETFAVRNQNSNSFLDLKTWSIQINSSGQRLDYLNVGNKILYNTDDATATNNDIVENKTAYVDGQKITGTIMERRNTQYLIPIGRDTTIQNQPRAQSVVVTSKVADSGSSYVIDSTNEAQISMPYEDVASAISLTAEKIVSGNTILGIEGTGGAEINNQDKTITQNGTYTADSGYTGLGEVTVNVPSGSGDVKLFETIAEMQADPNPQESDLAIVYRNDTTIPSPGDTINSFSPPATVVFDTPITSSTSLQMSGGNCILVCELDATSYTMRDVFGMIIQDIITYESSDGITYTRTDGGAESYDLSDEEVVVPSNADINILKFLSTGGMVFEGLYEYKTNQYVIADSQLTLLADKLLPDIIGYGKNGITVGNFGTNVSTTFNDDVAKIYTKAQIVYNNITPLVASDDNKRAGLSSDIVLVPCKSDGTPLLDTSNVTNMYNMFAWCSNLTLIPLLDTSKVTNMSQMFYDCTSLRMIPVLNTSNVTNMMGTFIRCTSMTYIPLLDTSNVTSMTSTFADCSSLTTIPLLDTSSVTTMYNCFLRLYVFDIYTTIRYK